ncbi:MULTISPECIES: IclR family transcriptional regulator [Paraburkholderia]|uniref:IclR family transcriptional regulator n=3 Tax=Burkholderiaceae TaxID=119060 RepID=UPI001EF81D56|nr:MULTISPECIES: IclR family transcriptional regulator [Paraburkholderia]MDH6152019.1 DNA-binding IclR family transcriptional regulator [Paraburkholderia sp. WSM4179]
MLRLVDAARCDTAPLPNDIHSVRKRLIARHHPGIPPINIISIMQEYCLIPKYMKFRMVNQRPRILPETEPVDDAQGKNSSLERMLSLLDQFVESSPVWSADELADALGFTRSAVYRYIRELSASGLLAPVATGRYSLGPRIIQLNRQLQESDPMLVAMQTLEADLPRFAAAQKWHLCRLFRDRVVAIGEYGHLDKDLSYRRGCPMPLLRGATSTAVLAWLPDRQLMRLYLENQDEARTPTLGASWPEYRKALAGIRKQGYALALAEVDEGVFALAAPVFAADGKVTGSISVVRSLDDYSAQRVQQEGTMLADIGRRISETIRQMAVAQHKPATTKTSRKRQKETR